MENIFTASAGSNGFWMTMLVGAADADAATEKFAAVLSAPEDEGGDYTIHELTEVVADEDGEYAINSGRGHGDTYYTADEVAAELARTGTTNHLGSGVILLGSGGNG